MKVSVPTLFRQIADLALLGIDPIRRDSGDRSGAGEKERERDRERE